MSKYNAKPQTVDGIRFDSKREAERYIVLREMEKRGDIYDLQRQVPFELIPTIKTPEGTLRKVVYKADFTYRSEHGVLVVEDVKGFKTDVYQLKKRLMYQVHGVWITET